MRIMALRIAWSSRMHSTRSTLSAVPASTSRSENPRIPLCTDLCGEPVTIRLLIHMSAPRNMMGRLAVATVLGRRIRELRHTRGWSHERLAEHAGLDRAMSRASRLAPETRR